MITIDSELDRLFGNVFGEETKITSARGRMSSSAPAIQNLPMNTPEGKRIREAFRKHKEADDVLINAAISSSVLRQEN